MWQEKKYLCSDVYDPRGSFKKKSYSTYGMHINTIKKLLLYFLIEIYN